ncbi:DNA-binding protein [Hymenobacter fodinae]|uniref:DNA-binding protein n=1 Tax=Hymenobacter fodinae TaxID=2510796 RepID=A0A4Z0PBC2_9BACT|nr:DNA-binding protein [Hymenobacter fodinae]TGE08777.1 DNA-binding protein [Hymenobacter fodinae]
MSALSLSLDFDPKQLATEIFQRQAEAHFASLPPPDPWLTIKQAAAYAQMSALHMSRLIQGRPYRAATADKPERPAVKSKIPHGDTGRRNGIRVRQSEIDKYLSRHAYKKNAA